MAVSVELAPGQMLAGTDVILATGFVLTVTVAEAVAVQTPLVETVTVYVVVEVGETVIAEVVDADASLHKNEFPPLADSVVLCPSQMAADAGEMVAVALLLTVTVVEALPVHAFASVTVTA